MNLNGDTNTPALPMTDAEVNHLRRLLAWMSCEMGQEPADMVVMTNDLAARIGPLQDVEGARIRLQASYDKSASYPAYVRLAVKMLAKALRDHERNAGIVEAAGKLREAACEVLRTAGSSRLDAALDRLESAVRKTPNG